MTAIAREAEGCVLVLFGATGDLTRRKLAPALYNLFLAGRLPPRFAIVGYGRTPLDSAAYRLRLREAMQKYADPADAADPALDAFLANVDYVAQKDGGIPALGDAVRKKARGLPVMYYLALAPEVSEAMLENFADGSLPAENARILLEKPFGSDLEAARRLNALLARSFPEANIHRIDHYLAKDTVRNLLVFRFANAIFEPIWNRHYVDHIQVSATETIGVEERGAFYDSVGVVRDMIQNHVLMLLALAAMEPPLAGDSESIRDRADDLLRSIAPPAPADFIFGQYEGYRRAANVDPESSTPTFAAVRLGIANWRWDGVPVYLVSGKALDARVSEVSLVFKHIPLCLLGGDSCTPGPPNMLTLRIHPDEGIRLSLGVKEPGYVDRVRPAALDFRYASLAAPAAGTAKASASGHRRHLFTGYERVLLEALAGKSDLFWRADGIESAWRVVGPMLAAEGGNLRFYPQGASGTELASPLFNRGGRRWLPSKMGERGI